MHVFLSTFNIICEKLMVNNFLCKYFIKQLFHPVSQEWSKRADKTSLLTASGMLLHAFPSMSASSLREFPENCVYRHGGFNCFIKYLHRILLTTNLLYVYHILQQRKCKLVILARIKYMYIDLFFIEQENYCFNIQIQ
jgi:hypothetical protein